MAPIGALSGARRALAVALLTACSAAHAQGGVYAGVQEDGTLHLTDRPPSSAYRLISGDPLSSTQTHGRTRFETEVREAAVRHGLDPLLVHAVIRAESGYDPRAVSRKGAAGLMQLMPQTAARFGVADRFAVEENLRGGTRYLRELLDLFDGDLRLALAAYNAGEAAVLRSGRRVPRYPETQEYVRRVQAHYKSLGGRGGG
jgi:soluble lytic murein transglycosylase-like protein